MKVLFAFLFGLIGTVAIGQDSWKVCFDKKIILNTSTEGAEKNSIKVSATDLKTTKNFTVTYTEASPQKGWERTITVYDERDNELKNWKGKKLTMKTSELKTLLNKYKTLKLYTLNSPTDPKLKARVRLRRVHLCTLVLQ